MLVTYKYSPNTGMTMLLFHSLEALEKQTKFLLTVLLVVFLLTTVMFFSLAYYLSNRLTKPLGGILNRLKDVSMGNFQLDNSINGNDEMGLIGRGVNEMAGNIGSLMGELIQQEHEKCELEYKVLLNQINPHFVYNFLNSIKVMADIQKIEGISEMASSLGTLLKEISKGSAEQVTIRRELELLDKYFYLQIIRKCGLLTIKYDIPDESVLDFLIPRFTLQPLAENSIYHGIDNVSRMGIITISITAQQDEVVIIIGDNGSGMSKEKIDSLLSAESMDGKEMTHVGIVNVDKRIKLFYGCGSLVIDSIVGESTTVTLRFPKILQGELTQRSVV
jgi:two-component system sensor histidine kinase YesM